MELVGMMNVYLFSRTLSRSHFVMNMLPINSDLQVALTSLPK